MPDVNRSAPDRSTADDDVQQRVVRGMRGLTNELEMYVAAAGREHRMGRTDLTGLAVVMDESAQGNPVTPGRLSAALQLSAPATSAMLDRLERLGHVHRTPHTTDRRSVVVEVTDHALAVGGAMFGRLAQHYAPLLADYDDDQLELVAGFLSRAAEATRDAREDISQARP
jgi:DNA-binding MarR family transcriptional regulator